MELTTKDIEGIEGLMLQQPQVECPVVHHFGPGIYIREVNLPAGIEAIGHRQKLDHLNVLLKGKMAMIAGDKVVEMEAPQIFIGTPGRKIGYVIEDCTWLNIYATDETDIEKLEETYLDKSDVWKDAEKENSDIRQSLREVDREDFDLFVKEYGLSKDDIRKTSENKTDYREVDIKKVCIRDSDIEGKGIFATYPIKKGEFIGPARVLDFRTQLGRYTNHSKTPNSFFQKLDNGNIVLIASCQIYGCIASGKGDEVTVDYRESLKLHQGEICQE